MDEQLPAVSDDFGTQLWDEQSHIPGGRLRRRVPKTVERDRMAKSIIEAFDQIGGVPRLAHWAHEHPGFFFTKLLPKVLPQTSEINHTGNLNITYRTAIPPGPLDGEFTDVTPTTKSEVGVTHALPDPRRTSSALCGAVRVESGGEELIP